MFTRSNGTVNILHLVLYACSSTKVYIHTHAHINAQTRTHTHTHIYVNILHLVLYACSSTQVYICLCLKRAYMNAPQKTCAYLKEDITQAATVNMVHLIVNACSSTQVCVYMIYMVCVYKCATKKYIWCAYINAPQKNVGM